jgi:hypothetical protein
MIEADFLIQLFKKVSSLRGTFSYEDYVGVAENFHNFPLCNKGGIITDSDIRAVFQGGEGLILNIPRIKG